MASELWEVVRAEELKAGDTLLDLRGGLMQSYELDEGLADIACGGPPGFYPPKLRRYSGPSPEVLMRAMRLMHFALYDEKLHVPMAGDPQNYIRQAEAEIEAETRGGAK